MCDHSTRADRSGGRTRSRRGRADISKIRRNDGPLSASPLTIGAPILSPLNLRINRPTHSFVSKTKSRPSSTTPTFESAIDGFGAGVETRRSYLAEEFPTGSQRNLVRWLTTLLHRDDVQRIWLKAVGSKDEIWSHEGTLHEIPDLDYLFAAQHISQIAA